MGPARAQGRAVRSARRHTYAHVPCRSTERRCVPVSGRRPPAPVEPRRALARARPRPHRRPVLNTCGKVTTLAGGAGEGAVQKRCHGAARPLFPCGNLSCASVVPRCALPALALVGECGGGGGRVGTFSRQVVSPSARRQGATDCAFDPGPSLGLNIVQERAITKGTCKGEVSPKEKPNLLRR